jgi:hypothetical protein
MSECGPAMLMYNGKVIYFGSANVAGFGKTAIYTPPTIYTGTGTWTHGPDIPKIGGNTMVCNDCPASLLPNGKVLVACAPFVVNNWGSPIEFLEYDPFTNTLQQVPSPPNHVAQIYWSRFMLLPTGQVLFSPSTSTVQCYTPDGGPQDAWRPVISSVVRQGISPSTFVYLLQGVQLNGLSQANMYGDDCNPSTNYPLVSLRNTSTGQVLFARTHDFSTRGVATGASPQSVRFSAEHVPYGHYELCVIANGISSHCVRFWHHHPFQHCHCEDCCRQKSECCCPGIDKEYVCDEKQPMQPEITSLRNEVHRLSRSVDRIAARIEVKEPHREPKEVKQHEKAQRERERRARPAARDKGRRKR